MKCCVHAHLVTRWLTYTILSYKYIIIIIIEERYTVKIQIKQQLDCQSKLDKVIILWITMHVVLFPKLSC